MCEWLVGEGYLAANPFAGFARVATPPVFDSATRSLDLTQWKCVLQSVERTEYSFVEHRDKLALLLAYATGLRRAELAFATTDALSAGRLSGVDGVVWRLAVDGGRGATRTVLLPPIVVETLIENLAMRGLPRPLDCAEGTPILAQARGGQSLTPDGIGKIFKTIFSNAAALMESHAPGAGRHLTRASTHWLRHTFDARARTRRGSARGQRRTRPFRCFDHRSVSGKRRRGAFPWHREVDSRHLVNAKTFDRS